MSKKDYLSKEVFKFVKKISRGKVITYKLLAKAVGRLFAYRAVGNILNKNKNLIKMPCHRVIKSDGYVGNYTKGEKNKINLLIKEGVKIVNKKICDKNSILIKIG